MFEDITEEVCKYILFKFNGIPKAEIEKMDIKSHRLYKKLLRIIYGGRKYDEA